MLIKTVGDTTDQKTFGTASYVYLAGMTSHTFLVSVHVIINVTAEAYRPASFVYIAKYIYKPICMHLRSRITNNPHCFKVKQFIFSGGSWLLGASAQLQVRQPLAFVVSLEQGLKLKLLTGSNEDL